MGSVKIRCYLSGMPELNWVLNDKILFDVRGRESTSATGGEVSSSSALSSQSNSTAVELEHVKFHQCVKLVPFRTRSNNFFHSS